MIFFWYPYLSQYSCSWLNSQISEIGGSNEIVLMNHFDGCRGQSYSICPKTDVRSLITKAVSILQLYSYDLAAPEILFPLNYSRRILNASRIRWLPIYTCSIQYEFRSLLWGEKHYYLSALLPSMQRTEFILKGATIKLKTSGFLTYSRFFLWLKVNHAVTQTPFPQGFWSKFCFCSNPFFLSFLYLFFFSSFFLSEATACLRTGMEWQEQTWFIRHLRPVAKRYLG